jgi:hypothetical protein
MDRLCRQKVRGVTLKNPSQSGFSGPKNFFPDRDKAISLAKMRGLVGRFSRNQIGLGGGAIYLTLVEREVYNLIVLTDILDFWDLIISVFSHILGVNKARIGVYGW